MIAVIINPIAGGASPAAADARAALAAAILTKSGEAGEVLVTVRRGHARELAAAAVARGARLVVAWGGDGTVNEVASALLFGETPLAIVPSGSGNGLARELGVSRRPARALAEAMRATPRLIDGGELGGRWFFSIAGVGFDAHIAACFDRDLGSSRGFAGYARITARELMAYKPSSYRISGGVNLAPRRAMFVTLANSPQWGNGARIAPGARLDDGRLDLVVFQERSRRATICALPRLFTGGVRHLRGMFAEQIEQATIESDWPMTFHVDGEPVMGGSHLEGRVHRSALRVAVR